MDFLKIKKFILNAILPQRCLKCGKLLSGEEVLCLDCFGKIEINSDFYCPRCGARLPEAKLTCHKEEKFILAAVTSYKISEARELIHAFKYNKLKIAVKILEKLIEKYLDKIVRNLSGGRRIEIRNFTIIPIPLHPQKERERGFNQSLLIAQILSKLLGLPVSQTLKKIKRSSPQVEMKNYKEREKNVEGSFSLADMAEIKNKNIIIVDDVFTSGATIREAIRTLKSAGAKKIIAFVIAKA
jgi:ComF family protein